MCVLSEAEQNQRLFGYTFEPRHTDHFSIRFKVQMAEQRKLTRADAFTREDSVKCLNSVNNTNDSVI